MSLFQRTTRLLLASLSLPHPFPGECKNSSTTTRPASPRSGGGGRRHGATCYLELLLLLPACVLSRIGNEKPRPPPSPPPPLRTRALYSASSGHGASSSHNEHHANEPPPRQPSCSPAPLTSLCRERARSSAYSAPSPPIVVSPERGACRGRGEGGRGHRIRQQRAESSSASARGPTLRRGDTPGGKAKGEAANAVPRATVGGAPVGRWRGS